MHYLIYVPNPCSQTWYEMTPDNNGRICDACEKTVVDFTAWHDEKILEYLLKNPGTCGRKYAQQLENTIYYVPGRNEKVAWKRWLIMAALPLLVQTAHTQTIAVPQQTVQTSAISQAVPSSHANPLTTDTLRVTLVDEQGEVVPFATGKVIRKEQTIETVVGDQNGIMEFYTRLQPGDTIVFSAIGLKKLQIEYGELLRQKKHTNGKITMAMDTHVLGEFIIIKKNSRKKNKKKSH